MTCGTCVVPSQVNFFETNNNSKLKYQKLKLLYQARHTQLKITTL
jgi:hypothetical protein